MKTTIKIIAYCIWFGFTLCLSFWFLRLVAWIENRTGILSPNIRFGTMLIFWFGFVFLLAWLPIWLMKRRALDSARLMAKVAIFLIMLLACTISCTVIWGNFVDGKLYNCTDSLPFNFLSPGDWVHGNYVTVLKIDPSDSMSKPDSIKEGWSVPKLWFLWFSFFAVSVAISLLPTFLICRRKKRTE
jgi:hypothetical protein